MQNPWDNDPIVGNTGPVYGSPRLPSPQTPAQAEHDTLGVQKLRTDIAAAPIEREGKQVNIEQGKSQIANTALDNVNNLRKQFEGEQPVQDYKTVLPLLDSALRIKNNKAGDLNLVYAFGKAMDPGSVVREGEQVMATNVGGVSEKVKGYIDQINGQGQLTPIQRTQLTEELRSRARALQGTYNQRRAFYEDFAKRSGINPNDVIGPHPGQPYEQDEAAYIEAHGGTPRAAGVPVGSAVPPEAGTHDELQFKDEQTPGPKLAPHGQEYHDQLYSALASKQLRTPAQINSWVQQFNQQNNTAYAIDWKNKETRLAIKNAMAGKQFGVEQIPDPRVTRKAAEMGQRGGLGDAIAVGATDALTLGGADELASAGAALRGSLSGEGSFGDLYGVNKAANNLYQQDLQGAHPYGYAGGQVAGSLLLPVGGVRTPAALAGVGAAYGGAYGFNSGGGAGDRALGALGGAAAGAAVGYAIPKGLSMIPQRGPKEVPPLVDPATGELNQPMDAMRPGARVQAMRDQGMGTITPGMAGGRSARVLEQGLNNLPGSAGVMEDVNSAASRELRNSMQGVAQKFGASKTLNEGGAQAQRGAAEWMDRADKVTAKVYNAISIPPETRATTAETVATLQQLTSKIKSNPELADEANDPTLRRYLDAIQSKGLDWEGLKEFRSFIGEKAGEFRFSQDARKGGYQALYGALSEDMRNTAAAIGPRQLHEFQRANSFYAAKEARIEGALAQILGQNSKGSPEKAAAAIQAMTKGGNSKGDLARLAQVKASTVKSGAWDEIASTLIHLGGQPANSEGRAFQPATFVNWYSDMAEPARRMLFKPELRKELDSFVAMNQQMSRLRGLNNTSGTTPTIIGASAMGSAGVLAMTAHPGGLLAVIGGGIANYGMAKAWTNPKFVNLITGYGRAAASGNQNAVKSQVGRLSKLAATNPELRSPIEHLLRSLANDNAVPAVAASTEPGGNQQN